MLDKFLIESPARIVCIEANAPFHPKTGKAIYVPAKARLNFVDEKNGNKMQFDLTHVIGDTFKTVYGTYQISAL